MTIYGLAPILVVADVRRSASFYEDVIGLPLRDSFTPDGCDAPAWAARAANARVAR